ncbi:MAG TPA: hypothetical protein VHR47_06735 [Bacillota bacterium]|nr:hypothetical protein [Bacillota bacterium]
MKRNALWVVGISYLLLLLVSGCGTGSAVKSTDVNQRVLYPTYSVTWENGSYEAVAIFDVGSSLGTSVELDAAESISCNGMVLQKHNKIIDYFYEGNINQPVSQYVFRYHNGADQDIDTTLGAVPAMPTLQAIPDFPEGRDLTVTWDATAPGKTVFVYITFPNSADAKSVIVYPADNGHYTITSMELSDAAKALAPGTYEVEIEIIRRTEYPVNAYFTKGGSAFTQSIYRTISHFTKTSPAVKSSYNAAKMDKAKLDEVLKYRKYQAQ